MKLKKSKFFLSCKTSFQIEIPVARVLNLTREKTAFIIPNAIGIRTPDDKFVFGSLLSRDSTFKLMRRVWELSSADVRFVFYTVTCLFTHTVDLNVAIPGSRVFSLSSLCTNHITFQPQLGEKDTSADEDVSETNNNNGVSLRVKKDKDKFVCSWLRPLHPGNRKISWKRNSLLSRMHARTNEKHEICGVLLSISLLFLHACTKWQIPPTEEQLTCFCQ